MNPPPAATPALAAQARQVFVRHLIDDLPQVLQRLLDDLQERSSEAVYSDASQRLQDTRVHLQRLGPAWLDRCRTRLSQSLKPAAPAPDGHDGPALSLVAEEAVDYRTLEPAQIAKRLQALEQQMYQHARDLEFEDAARLRDQIQRLKEASLGG